MKTKIFIASFCGVVVGAAMTYGLMRFKIHSHEEYRETVPQEKPEPEGIADVDAIDPVSEDQVAEGGEIDPFVHISSQGYTTLDMGNRF